MHNEPFLSTWGEATPWITVYDQESHLSTTGSESTPTDEMIAFRWSLPHALHHSSKNIKQIHDYCAYIPRTAFRCGVQQCVDAPSMSQNLHSSQRRPWKPELLQLELYHSLGEEHSSWSAGADTKGSGSTFGEDSCSILSSLGLPLPPFLPPPLLFLHPSSWLCKVLFPRALSGLSSKAFVNVWSVKRPGFLAAVR